MPKVKAGTLKPVIDQLKSQIQEKKDAFSPAERRGMSHRLRRLQRKARRIRKEEEHRAAPAPKAAPSAEAESQAEPAAES